jgi:diacylglycerol kinase family enzyme
MQATVIYNQNAGSIKSIPREELEAALKIEGFFPVFNATDSEDELEAALDGVEGLVLTVGGDGTLRATALHLLGRKGVQLAFIPAGTANNVAHSFGIQDWSWQDIIKGLKGMKQVPFDVGKVTGPLGTNYFLEAFGAGLFADTLASYDPEQGKSVWRGFGTLLDVLPNYKAQDWRISLDGQEVSGSYLLLEVLNTPMTGPHLNLAPLADPSDGLFNVLLISDSQREGLLTYARKMRAGELAELDSVTITCARRIELVWTGFPLHFDADVKVDIEDPREIKTAHNVSDNLRDEHKDVIAVEVMHAALTLRVPQTAEEAKS